MKSARMGIVFVLFGGLIVLLMHQRLYVSANLYTILLWPSSGFLGSLYSQNGHNGLDIWTNASGTGNTDRFGDSCSENNPNTCSKGNPVYPPYPGQVTHLYYHPTGVLQGLRIEHGNVNGTDIWTHYFHMADEDSGDSYVEPELDNQWVDKKTLLGYQGDKLWNEGAQIVHLHFTISDSDNDVDSVDPSSYFGINLNQNDPNHVGWHHYVQRSSPSTPRIAVTSPGYDNVGEILTRLGYEWNQIQDSDLNDYNTIKQYDIIFANCSSAAYDNGPNAASALRQFVQHGGSLYASDWSYRYIDSAFPGYITFSANPRIGSQQTVTTEIIDSGLANYLNPSHPPNTVDLNYDLNDWAVIEDVATDTQVFLRGTFSTLDGSAQSLQLHEKSSRGIENTIPLGQKWDKPLAVFFQPYPDSTGRVIYTTFHNEAQQTDIENKMLEYLVLVPRTSDLVAGANAVVEADGAHVDQENLDTIDAGETSVPVGYEVPGTTRLVFATNWSGSTLRLSVLRPDGSLYEQVESSTPPISVFVPAAEQGRWKYQITGVDVPYDNYPYVVSMGKPKGCTLPDDIDGDGDVDATDIQREVYHWRQVATLLHNFDSDNTVTVADIMHVVSSWGRTCDNFILNRGFEQAAPSAWKTDAWQGGSTFVWDNTQAYDGNRSVRIVSPVANDARWIQAVPVNQNTDYILWGFIKTEDVAHIEGPEVVGANLGLYGTWEHTSGLLGTNDWRYVIMGFNSGDNTEVTVACRLGYWSGTATGSMWCDNIGLSESFSFTLPLSN